MTNCVGILDCAGKTWGVCIPDLPGCYGGGASAEAAIEDAASTAREWLAHQLGNGLAQPKAQNRRLTRSAFFSECGEGEIGRQPGREVLKR